jgi:RNase P/RNase MRP subunit p29
MIDTFFPDTSSLYQSVADLIPFKITSIVLEPQKIDIEKIKNGSTLTSAIVAFGKRLDGTSSSVYILIPLGKDVNVGDYILAKEYQNFYLFVQKIYSPKIKGLDIIENSYRFVPHWLKDRVSFGFVYNENTFYGTFTHSFIDKYQDKNEYLKKRFFDYPSLNVYHTNLDVFQYDKIFEDLLERDLAIDNFDARYIFENCENPVYKTFLSEQNTFDKHPFRTDPVFDFWRDDYSDDLVLIKDSKLDYSSFLKADKSKTDSYPNPFKEEIKKFFVADQIIKNTGEEESPYDYEPLKPVEYWEARVGRNQIVLSRDSFEKGLSFFKTQADQGLFMIFDLRNELYNLRLKSLYSSLSFEEYKGSFNRFHVGLKKGNYFEIYEEEDLSSIHSQILISEEIESLKNSGSTPSKYSSLVLAKDKNSSFKRLAFEEAQNNGYSFTLSAKHGSNKSYVSSFSNSSGSLVEIKSQKDSNYALQTFSGTDGKIVIETNNDLKIVIDSSGVIQILAGSSVIGTFSKSGNTITLNANGTIVTINSSGVSINKDTSVSGNVNVSGTVNASGVITGALSVGSSGPGGPAASISSNGEISGSKFTGSLNCTGTVTPGSPGAINVTCV